MKKGIIAMSAMSLVLSMSFADSGYAEEAQAAVPAAEPIANEVGAANAPRPTEQRRARTRTAQRGRCWAMWS